MLILSLEDFSQLDFEMTTFVQRRQRTMPTPTRRRAAIQWRYQRQAA